MFYGFGVKLFNNDNNFYYELQLSLQFKNLKFFVFSVFWYCSINEKSISNYSIMKFNLKNLKNKNKSKNI